MSTRVQQATSCVLLIIGCTNYAASKQQTENNAVCDTPCKCLGRLAVQKAYLEGALEHARQSIKAFASSSRQHTIAAGATNTKLAALAAPLAAITLTKAAEAADALAQHAPTIAKEIAHLNELAVLYEAKHRLAGELKAAKLLKSSNYETATFTPTEMTIQNRRACEQVDESKEYRYDELNFDKEQGIPTPALTLEISMGCQKNPGDTGGACDGTNADDGVVTKLTFTTAAPVAETSPLVAGAYKKTSKASLSISNRTEEGRVANSKAAHEAAKRLMAIKQPSDLSTYTDDSSFALLVGQLAMKPPLGAELTPALRDQVNKFITDNYGANEGDFRSKFLPKAEQAAVFYLDGKSKKTKKISELESKSELVTASGYAFFKGIHTETAEKVENPRSQGNPETAENKKEGGNTAKPVCSTIQNQTECEGVKGTPPTGKAKVCGWIEGKCQDSSFVLSKQFALSVVSAAFAALLF
uniref:Metacyclic variable antigen variant surface glycoprotein 7 n=1 Tax=Trypanosoma brucei TaxID=5691 RepID=P90594_9TRYP|nr:metacyclic variable antigen variant surface glycoprotein 7 [Trypanosoma brucei]